MNSNGMDIISLIFLGIAVLIFLYLRSILGRRTGNERTHYDPYNQDDRKSKEIPTKTNDNDNVVQMPEQRSSPEFREPPQPVRDIKAEIGKFAEAGTPLNKGLLNIADVDEEFDPTSFMQGAERAYEMIITDFAEGNKRSLKKLLARDVYNRFAESIDSREKAGETMSTSFIGFDKVTMLEADLNGKQAEITIKFKSSLVRSVHNREGEVIDGDETNIEKITDIWTFGRNASSRDPNWKLIATDSES